MTTCHFWTEPDDPADDRCAWCSQPRVSHRLVPCLRCAGWGYVPDPSDRSPGPSWLKQGLPCPVCTGDGQKGGWVLRATGRPARDFEVDVVRKGVSGG
jgi:hypothetical protein